MDHTESLLAFFASILYPLLFGEEAMDKNLQEAEFATQTLERYSGCPADTFHSNLILTNFPKYVDYFAKSRGIPILEGCGGDKLSTSSGNFLAKSSGRIGAFPSRTSP